MSAVTGGALPTNELLEARMRELGMIDPTREERAADLEAVFAPTTYYDADGTLRNADGSRSIFDDLDDDPEQQEWVISGLEQPE